MKYISPLISDARNKLGGSVFARNRSGVYARARVAPTQPRTPSQVANRTGFASITANWKTITQAQRAGWNTLASTRTLTDSLGNKFRPSGFQLFVSCNRNIVVTGGPTISDPPDPTVNPGTWQWGNIVISTDTGSISAYEVDWNVLDVLDDLRVVFSCTPALSPGITFVAPHLYRVVAADYMNSAGADIGTAWGEVFGFSLAPGFQIGLRVRTIQQSTGLQQSDNTFLSPTH